MRHLERRFIVRCSCPGVVLSLPAAPLLDVVLVFDLTLAMRPSSAVSDGVSRRHGRNPAIGLGPAGWEGSPGSARRSRHSDACPVPGTGHSTAPFADESQSFLLMLLLISVRSEHAMIALVEDTEPSARDIAKLIQQIKIGLCPSDLCRYRFGCRKATGH